MRRPGRRQINTGRLTKMSLDGETGGLAPPNFSFDMKKTVVPLDKVETRAKNQHLHSSL